MAGKTVHQRFRFEVPKGLNKTQKDLIAEDVINWIRQKAINENAGWAGSRYRKFPAYEKEYAKKKGTSRGNVTLHLTNEMFDSMKRLNPKSTGRWISVGFEKGSKENGKADGNQRGTYGQDAPIRGKARPFMGISKKDLNDIMRNVKAE